MNTRYYIREISTKNYYFAFHAEEGFLPDINNAYKFYMKEDVLAFFQREENSSLLEGRELEIVEIFCF